MATTTTTSPTPIVFYDIRSGPPLRPYATNPWKARYALNFKAVPYSTHWVSLPDVASVRRSVGAPPVRSFGDGSDFYTLPMLTDASTSASPPSPTIVGDSLDIARHLQTHYPAAGDGDLFPTQTIAYTSPHADAGLVVPLSKIDETSHAEYARFNASVDATFSAHAILMGHGLPFEPETAELSKAEFARRAGVESWDVLTVRGEARERVKEGFRRSLDGLAEVMFGEGRGPFMLGEKATYADMIVGGWLKMMSITLPEEEWREVREWCGGVFGRLHDALERYAQVK